MSNKTWFSSDFHFMHTNICKGCTNWKNKRPEELRDFDNPWKMSEHIIHSLNEHIGQDDNLYFLGDWSFGGTDNVTKFRNMLHCKNIHFVLGNHDKLIRNNGLSMGVRCHSLFTSVQERLMIKAKNFDIVCDHYAGRTWWGSHKGSIQLHAHSHGALEYATDPINTYFKSKRTMDVGIDNAFRIFGEYVPFSLEYILDTLSTRSLSDHHDE